MAVSPKTNPHPQARFGRGLDLNVDPPEVRPGDLSPDGYVGQGHGRDCMEPDRPVDSAKGEEVELGLGIIGGMAFEEMSRVAGDITGRNPVRSKASIHPHHQDGFHPGSAEM